MHGGKTAYVCALASGLLLVSCGGDEARTSSSDSDSGITASGSGTDTTPTASGSASDSNSGGTDSSSASASGSASDSDGTSGTGSASDSDSASASASATTSGGPKFDVGEETTGAGTGGGGDCKCGSQLDFSYIWIANSSENTVTKLNTQTMIEEGRYPTDPGTGPGQVGSPSRTSVSISGLAVAVANRNGGVVKVHALPELCDEMQNGQPGLQTSTNKTPLAWGQDDCVAWFTDFDYTTQRPVAWQAGTLDFQTCTYSGERVWTAGCNTATDTWVTVSRLNGDTGVIEDQVLVTGFECSSLSPYGGAVDSKGNFWFTNLVPGNDRMAMVDAQNPQTFQVWTQNDMPLTPYGMTVDSKDRVWLASWTGSGNASAARYDPVANTWAVANNHVAYVMSGIQEDAEGRMWMNYWTYDGDGTNPGLTYIDAETMVVGPAYGINCAASSCRGMSIDLDGNVWSTAQSMNTAFRFNPDTLQVDTYDQLVFPYTYSDMTGWAVQNATCDPEG